VLTLALTLILIIILFSFTDIPLTADLEAALKASWQAVVGGEFDIVVSGVDIYLILSLCVVCVSCLICDHIRVVC
jgi:hypothetical protein